jgi:hypothetical protein
MHHRWREQGTGREETSAIWGVGAEEEEVGIKGIGKWTDWKLGRGEEGVKEMWAKRCSLHRKRSLRSRPRW